MSFGAPDKAERIAAHRAPTRREEFSVILVALWKYNRRLFWQLATGVLGGAFIIGAILAFMVAVIISALA